MVYRVAVLPGDGIGPEVTAQARKVMNKAALITQNELLWQEFPFGAEYYLAHNVVLPPGALNDIGAYDALLLGAVGDPKVPPGPLEQELLLALRFHFDQYLNLRPALSFPNVPLPCPIPPDRTINIAVVRENTEDYYMGLGGLTENPADSFNLSAPRKLYSFKATLNTCVSPETKAAFSLGLLSEPGIRRITQKALTLTKARGEKSLTVATKANALPQYYGFWDKITRSEAEKCPDIRVNLMNVDNLCYQLPRDPLAFGVILCPNLFGDIVSDLVSALAGGLGLAASGNIGDSLSMFEPVHGSAPDIAGTGKANPLAAILSGAMLLEHLKLNEAARLITKAVAEYLAGGLYLPLELGGPADTDRVGTAVADLITEPKRS
ncbi:MAG: isocitrate/isopropylmalate dehydrogenase family protein [Deltaproteobacteria bacterium]|nr:isocitrate/isopropylmalate dehydrogenase family protein [Deltaproteobacteria bacterium]